MSTLLADVSKINEWTWSGIANALEGWDWLQTLLNTIDTVLWVVLILVGAVGSIYAIYVGVKMARADSAEAREESKKRLINIIVSIAVTIALILFFNILLPGILSNLGVFDSMSKGYTQSGSGTTGGSAIETVRAIIGR